MSLEQRVAILERQMKSLRRLVHVQEELLNTIASPPWKRLWWFVNGWRLWRLGRWYGGKHGD